jgi:hypothetical protein
MPIYQIQKLAKDKNKLPDMSDVIVSTGACDLICLFLKKLESKLMAQIKGNVFPSADMIFKTKNNGFYSSDLLKSAIKEATKNEEELKKTWKTLKVAKDESKLTFNLSGTDLSTSIWVTTVLEIVAIQLLKESDKIRLKPQQGVIGLRNRKQLYKGDVLISLGRISPGIGGDYDNDIQKIAYFLGFTIFYPSIRQSQTIPYSEYGYQIYAHNKGVQGAKSIYENIKDSRGLETKSGSVEFEKQQNISTKLKMSGYNIQELWLILNAKYVSEPCGKKWQTRSLTDGKCEGNKPCKGYQSWDEEKKRCTGKKPKGYKEPGEKKGSKRRSRRKSPKCSRFGRLKSPIGSRTCKKRRSGRPRK